MSLGDYFEFQRTSADGAPLEPLRRLEYAEAGRLLALSYPGELKQLRHFLALACAAPGHPVDVTAFVRGALVYSARLVYRRPHTAALQAA